MTEQELCQLSWYIKNHNEKNDNVTSIIIIIIIIMMMIIMITMTKTIIRTMVVSSMLL